MARKAGLSEYQQREAANIANIPRERFEALVESDKPPTITALAEEGKKTRPVTNLEGRSPQDYQAATHLLGAPKYPK